MPRDDKDEKEPAAMPLPPAPAVALGRTFRGETSPPVTTPEAIAETRAKAAEHSSKPDAVTVQVYFVTKGIDNPILQASMLAYTKIRVAPVEDFDEIFAAHHDAPAPKTEETKP